jgi:hypothetical protein
VTTQPKTDAPQVLMAISAVMADVAREGISKDRRNTSQNYAFRGIDDVYNALAPVLAKHKLIITPRGKGRSVTERESRSGGMMFFVNVEMEYQLTSAIDGSSIMAGPFYGEAMDSGDKATNKAQSAAFKYMAMQQFCIPTEGDNDADASTYEVRAPAARTPTPRPTPSRDEPAPQRPRMEVVPNAEHPYAPRQEPAQAPRAELRSTGPSPRPAPSQGFQRAQAPSPVRVVNRSGSRIPAPVSDEVDPWRRWFRAVHNRVQSAGTASEIEDVRRMHLENIARGSQVVEGSVEALDLHIRDRLVELNGGRAA